MSKFTRCSHPFLLIYISSFASQRNRRHPQPIFPAPRMFFQHLGTSFTLPYLSAAQSWFIALFAFTAVPLLPSLRYRTEQGFRHQPKYRLLVHISLRLVTFGNWMFEVVVNLIASKSIFLFLFLVQREGGANRCKPAIGSLMDLSEYSSLALLPRHPWVG